MPAEILAGTVFNVLDYGAVADYNEFTQAGTANDSAFAAARNAAAAVKGVVLIPPGKYKLTGTLELGETVHNAPLTWQGVSTPGYGQQSILFYTGSGTALKVMHSGTVLRACRCSPSTTGRRAWTWAWRTATASSTKWS